MRLIVGNWKMNGSFTQNQALLDDVKKAVSSSENSNVQAVVCAPFPYLAQCQQTLKASTIQWGAQNLSEYADGAYTGEVSAKMIGDFGCQFVIVGHSERRSLFGESNDTVAQKVKAALEHQLRPILCVGETLAQREAGQVEAIVGAQLKAVIECVGTSAFRKEGIVVAYEPVWAIGTGKNATPEEAASVHTFIHETLVASDPEADGTRILYGGSMKPENATELLSQPHIHGGLIGGASLKAESFLGIVNA